VSRLAGTSILLLDVCIRKKERKKERRKEKKSPMGVLALIRLGEWWVQESQSVNQSILSLYPSPHSFLPSFTASGMGGWIKTLHSPFAVPPFSL